MGEKNDKTIGELFDELKDDLTFVPDIDAVKEGYLFAFKWILTN